MAKLACPECKETLRYLKHDRLVEIESKFHMDEEGFTTDTHEIQGGTVDETYTCPECGFETVDVNQFMVDA